MEFSINKNWSEMFDEQVLECNVLFTRTKMKCLIYKKTGI